MGAVVLDNGRIRMVLAMFQNYAGRACPGPTSGTCPCLSTAMVSLLPAGKKRPSKRTAVALIHGLEKLLTCIRRLVCSVLPWWAIPMDIGTGGQ